MRIIVIVLFLFLIYAYSVKSEQCEEAGGVYAPPVCVNPSAIIELD